MAASSAKYVAQSFTSSVLYEIATISKKGTSRVASTEKVISVASSGNGSNQLSAQMCLCVCDLMTLKTVRFCANVSVSVSVYVSVSVSVSVCVCVCM